MSTLEVPVEGRADNARITVWDVPTRVFHWTFAATFAAAFLTLGEDRWLHVHVFAGYLALGALGFRIIWGLVGNYYARFGEFAYHWRTVAGYLGDLLHRRARRYPGHNPAGSWAIFALLGLGLAITLSGIAVLGTEEVHGLLAGVFSPALDAPLKWTHENLSWLMLGLIALHVAGVVVESFMHRESLTLAMLTGSKPRRDGHEHDARYTHVTLGVGLVIWVLAFGGAFFRGQFTAGADAPFRPFEGPQLARNDTWSSECGDCHLAFHPNLLPARSWRRLLAEQDRHFGEDLGLDPETIDTLRVFAVDNAADLWRTEAARKVGRSIAATDTPLRVTATAYWRAKHQEIDPRYWKRADVRSRANCAACHLDADLGTFEDAAMHLPPGGPAGKPS